jgi:hypothetical protein
MLISHIGLFEAAEAGLLERKRRAARKAFKNATDGKGGFRLWTLICPQRKWDNATGGYTARVGVIRLVIRVEKYGGGMRQEHTVRGWIYPHGRGSWAPDPVGMTDMQEESKITAMGDRSNANWGINPDLEELRSYARIVVDILSGDCLTELRLAAMSDSKKSVIGA